MANRIGGGPPIQAPRHRTLTAKGSWRQARHDRGAVSYRKATYQCKPLATVPGHPTESDTPLQAWNLEKNRLGNDLSLAPAASRKRETGSGPP